MALFHTTVLDNQIKALPTVDTASGSVATFDTDMTENLVEVKCQIVAQQSGSGTPSPSNPRPITTYTSLNLSHSGSDTSNPNVTNIPFGQTVANGVLDITTGKLRVTHGYKNLGDYTYTYQADNTRMTTNITDMQSSGTRLTEFLCDIFTSVYDGRSIEEVPYNAIYSGANYSKALYIKTTETDANAFKTMVTGHYIVIPLTVPIIVQLSAQTITALLNENNIWCDTGDTEVKYLLTVGKKIS